MPNKDKGRVKLKLYVQIKDTLGLVYINILILVSWLGNWSGFHAYMIYQLCSGFGPEGTSLFSTPYLGSTPFAFWDGSGPGRKFWWIL